MSRHSWEMRRSDAAETIVRECYDVMRRRHEASASARPYEQQERQKHQEAGAARTDHFVDRS